MAVLEAALVDWLSQSLALRGFCGGHEGRCAGKLYAGTGEMSKEPHWAMQLCSLHLEEAALLRLLHSLGELAQGKEFARCGGVRDWWNCWECFVLL